MKKLVKRIIPILLLAILLCTAYAALAAGERVVDDANLFTREDAAAIGQRIAQFQEKTGMDFVVYTSAAGHAGKKGEAVAQDFYDYNGYGLDDEHSGVLYFIDMAERKLHIITTGVMIDIIDHERVEALLDVVYDNVSKGEYAASVTHAIERTQKYVDKGVKEGQYRYDKETGERLTSRHKVITGTESLICMIAAVLACLIFVKTVHRGYNLKGSTYHYDYSKYAAAELTESRDDYLRTTTTRVRKAESSSGGGGRSGGSGVSRGSSGTSHGGGSRSF